VKPKGRRAPTPEADLARRSSRGVTLLFEDSQRPRAETTNRFARDPMVQVGHAMLKDRGITLIAADCPDSFLDDTPSAKLIRHVLDAVSEFKKATIVSKLSCILGR